MSKWRYFERTCPVLEPLVGIRQWRRYVSVEIDMLSTRWRLTREGQSIVRAILCTAAHETFALGRRSNRAISYAATAEYVFISAMDRRVADRVIREVLETIRTPSFQLPRRARSLHAE